LFFTENSEQEEHLRYAHADKRCQVVIFFYLKLNLFQMTFLYFSRKQAYVICVEALLRTKGFWKITQRMITERGKFSRALHAGSNLVLDIFLWITLQMFIKEQLLIMKQIFTNAVFA
jgi:hypothetical protein